MEFKTIETKEKKRETPVTELKLKCSKCKKKKATGFHQQIPFCTDCYLLRRMEKHPMQLKVHLQREQKQLNHTQEIGRRNK